MEIYGECHMTLVVNELISRKIGVLVVATFLASTLLSGCASESSAAKGAQRGAATGAASGAVGGIVSALLFGGNVAEAGVKGAVIGSATGATAGALSGSAHDKATAERQAEQEKNEADRLRRELGPDAYNGVVALAHCKHEVALANARVARKDRNRDYRLAGLWVEILTLADQRQETAARELFPELIREDRDVRNDAEAEATMRDAVRRLTEIRRSYGLPEVCGA